MVEPLYLRLRDIAYKNRRTIQAGNRFELPLSAQRLMKKTTIKLRGENNRLVLGEGAEVSHCEIRLDGKDNLIEIGPRVRISSGKIYLRHTTGQHIRIGADTTIEDAYLLVDESASIEIGNDCMLSTDILIRTGDKHSIIDVATDQRVNHSRDIRIADRVWIGRGVQILKGIVLQRESVVGTCSLVTKAFDEGNCVIAGVPAKIVKRGIRWDRQLI